MDAEVILAAALLATWSYTFGCRVTARRIARSMTGRPSGIFATIESRRMEREREAKAEQNGEDTREDLAERLQALVAKAREPEKPGPYL